MFYHARQLKYVEYGKIYPAPLEKVDEDLLKAYKWLGKYSGFCPQVWLARGKSSLTGYKSKYKQKARFCQKKFNEDPKIMFGFDIIMGFPVSFDVWEIILQSLISLPLNKDPVKDGDAEIEKHIREWVEDAKKENCEDDFTRTWDKYNNFKEFLNKELFVEKDQVVVPSLNLKVAKVIYCRNEKQVKQLRRMGFIEDRIKILNNSIWKW